MNLTILSLRSGMDDIMAGRQSGVNAFEAYCKSLTFFLTAASSGEGSSE